MKRLMSCAAFCVSALSLFAQEQLHITYQVYHQFELPGVEGIDSAMLAEIPRESTQLKDLYYAGKKSIYQNQPKPEKPIEADNDNGRRIIVNMDGGDDILYTDFEKKQKTEQTEFMGRQFLIKSELEAPKFKLTGKQKQIAGYACQEAEWAVDSTQTVIIWFAPQLTAAVGPADFSGFPGAVLSIEMDNGKHKITAVSVETTNVPTDKIVAPKDGKKVTPEEFQAIVAEKHKEMQEQYGGDGNAVIKIIRN